MSSSISSSAEIIGGNQDLLTEILLRLSAKPLLKFKRVSKQWLSLISNPDFCLSHTRRHRILNPKPKALLLNNCYTPAPQFQVVPLEDDPAGSTKLPVFDYFNRPRIKILQSCNGLLLCSSNFLVYPNQQICDPAATEELCFDGVNFPEVLYDYFVCNPTTKQFKKLTFPSREFEDSVVGLSLAFDPLKSPHHKVIAVRSVDRKEYIGEIDVYSSETGSWGLLRISFEMPCAMSYDAAVFSNGAIHWYSQEETSVYFDVECQSLKTMPMPSMFNLMGRICHVTYFGESRGHLQMVVNIDSPNLEFDVLEMESDYSRWFVRYHVCLDSMKMAFPELIWHRRDKLEAFSVLFLNQSEKEEESMLVVFVDSKAMYYNLYDASSKKICDVDRGRGLARRGLDYAGLDAYQYFETLVPI